LSVNVSGAAIHLSALPKSMFRMQSMSTTVDFCTSEIARAEYSAAVNANSW
jgi:hypothetical protein